MTEPTRLRVVGHRGACLLWATQMYLIANKDVARYRVVVPEPHVQSGRAPMEILPLQTSPVATASNDRRHPNCSGWGTDGADK